MKITKLQGLTVLSMLAVSTFTSCEEHNPFSEQELLEQEYSKNFFKTYGNIPEGFNWDLSETLPITGATDGSVFDLGFNMGASAGTRAGERIDVVKKEGWYYIPETTVNWMASELPEGVKANRDKGKPFTLVYSGDRANNEFALIPLYKGNACIKWKLHIVTSNEDRVIWDPWEGRAINDEYTSDFQYKFTNGTYQDQPLRGNMSTTNSQYAVAPRSHPIVVSNITGEFYFYLEMYHVLPENFEDLKVDGVYDYTTDAPNWDKGWTRGYGYKGEQQSSREGMMLALTSTEVTGNISELLNAEGFESLVGFAGEATKAMVIGCEDSKYSDWDINDITFLYVSHNTLPEKRVARSKRYMIEDLGSTVDWDFNDIVVDVTETYLESSGENPTPEQILTQEATIKHLCGTVPFQVYFKGDGSNYNDISFNKIQGIVQNVNAYYMPNGHYVKKTYVKGSGKPFWDSMNNNIRVKIFANKYNDSDLDWNEIQNDQSAIYSNYDIPFPDKEHTTTKAPLMIATPITEMWTEESQNIPEKWVKSRGN